MLPSFGGKVGNSVGFCEGMRFLSVSGRGCVEGIVAEGILLGVRVGAQSKCVCEYANIFGDSCLE